MTLVATSQTNLFSRITSNTVGGEPKRPPIAGTEAFDPTLELFHDPPIWADPTRPSGLSSDPGKVPFRSKNTIFGVARGARGPVSPRLWCFLHPHNCFGHKIFTESSPLLPGTKELQPPVGWMQRGSHPLSLQSPQKTIDDGRKRPFQEAPLVPRFCPGCLPPRNFHRFSSCASGGLVLMPWIRVEPQRRSSPDPPKLAGQAPFRRCRKRRCL